MENEINKKKKLWAKPQIVLLDSDNVASGNHTKFFEISQLNSNTFYIEKRKSHTVYKSSIGGWNYAAHS